MPTPKRKKGSMKGFTQKSGDKRPTKSGAGMTAKGVAKYRRQNPGSKLKTAVTGKVKKGSKASFFPPDFFLATTFSFFRCSFFTRFSHLMLASATSFFMRHVNTSIVF